MNTLLISTEIAPVSLFLGQIECDVTMDKNHGYFWLANFKLNIEKDLKSRLKNIL